MNVIIPAKATSTRVPDKNWREFHDGMSLTEIKVRQVIDAGVEPSTIYISCEDEDKPASICHRLGTKILLRDPGLCDNSVPLPAWIRAITSQVPGDGDIAWVQVTDPLFGSFGRLFDRWSASKQSGHDSLVVACPWKGYLMTDGFQPVGWSFGEHHTPSQNLPQFMTMPFTASMLTRDAIRRTGYHVGATPEWLVHDGPHIDIDTEFDFDVARSMYVSVNGSSP